MDDILESIPPPSLVVGGPQGLRFHGLPRPITATSYSPVFDNDQTIESMIANNGHGTGCLSTMPNLPLKRTLPSLYWDDKDMAAETSLGKRSFGMDLGNDSAMERATEGNNSGSISSLLCQIPAAAAAAANTSMQPQSAGLGSIGENVLRPPYQLPGLNWYA